MEPDRFNIDRLQPRSLDRRMLGEAEFVAIQAEFYPFTSQEDLKHFLGWLLASELFVTAIATGTALETTQAHLVQIIDLALMAAGYKGTPFGGRLKLSEQFWYNRFVPPDEKTIGEVTEQRLPRTTPKGIVAREAIRTIKLMFRESILENKNNFGIRIKEAGTLLRDRPTNWRVLCLVAGLEALTSIITVPTSEEWNNDPARSRVKSLQKWQLDFLINNVDGWRQRGLRRTVTLLYAIAFPPSPGKEASLRPGQKTALCEMFLDSRNKLNVQSILKLIEKADATLRDFGEPGPFDLLNQ